MPFTHISHGTQHLRIQSDDGHHFLFAVVKNESGDRVVVGSPQWRNASPPPNHSEIADAATRFAFDCAQAFGLR